MNACGFTDKKVPLRRILHSDTARKDNKPKWNHCFPYVLN